MSRILLCNGKLVDPSQNLERIADLLIENGKISASPGNARDTQVIDATGLFVLPGLIDVHVHLREPGQEHKETIATGIKAALRGGFTSVACMANTNPVNDRAETTRWILERARAVGGARVFPIGAITRGLQGTELADLDAMVNSGARALSDDGRTVMNSQLMREAMEKAKFLGVSIISHAEDETLIGNGVMNEGPRSRALNLRGIPAAAEEIAVARDIALCRLTGCRLHIAHLSTIEALEHVQNAKKAGLPITAEVTPHHLLLCDDDVDGMNTAFKMAPPLRGKKDVMALREALASGVIDIIATDHAPHSDQEKAVPFGQAANGVTGLETAASLTYELVRRGELSLSRWVDALTVQPARLLGLPLGTLRSGASADITLWDPACLWTYKADQVASKSRNSPFLGKAMAGKALMTLVEGKIAFKEAFKES